MSAARDLPVETVAQAVAGGDRAMLARAITLVESNRDADIERAQALLALLLPRTGSARRIGLTGVPGAGKSTLIDRLGTMLVDAGRRVAVLAVDPSSPTTRGSILGDKTRMGELSQRSEAFIRPSPAGGSLGGVGRKTRETILLCEAAGFDVVIVETVGVGQSETLVSEMVDTFVVLLLAGAGDELQGIKRGIIELADVLCVNKADGENVRRAELARREYEAALRTLRRDDGWTVPVLTSSAVTPDGVDGLWGAMESHLAASAASGALESRRRAQRHTWLWSLVDEGVRSRVHGHASVQALAREVEAAVERGEKPVSQGAKELLERIGSVAFRAHSGT